MAVSRSRWILLLLLQGEGKQRYNKPVVGRTRLIKELFILKMAYGLKDLEYDFIPYWYGPFCPEVYADLEELKTEGLVFAKDSVGGEAISLSPNGLVRAQSFERAVNPDHLRKIRNCKERFNSKPFEELVAYVYESWPNYTSRALESPGTVLKELRAQSKKARITEADVDAAIAAYRSRSAS